MGKKRKASYHDGQARSSKPNSGSSSTEAPPPSNVDIEIDGSKGEGGGQIVRSSIALSCILNRSVRISKIRYSRPRPGLQAQHSTGAKLAVTIAGAQSYGIGIGSLSVVIVPQEQMQIGKQRGNDPFECNANTAASTSLILQQALPVALRCLSRQPVNTSTEEAPRLQQKLHIGGGTTVPFAPPSEYICKVLVPNLMHFGIVLNYKIEMHGFFPRGGGLVSATVAKDPNVEGATLKSVDCVSRGAVTSISVTILTSSGLTTKSEASEHIVNSIHRTVLKALKEKLPMPCRDLKVNVNVEAEDAQVTSKGQPDKTKNAFLTLYAVTESGFVLGASGMWSDRDAPRLHYEMKSGGSEKGGKRQRDNRTASVDLGMCVQTAAYVAETAVSEFCDVLHSQAVVDSHMADQLCIFMAMATGKSRLLVPKPTLHLTTMLDVLKQFGVNIYLEEVERSENVTLHCEGLGIAIPS